MQADKEIRKQMGVAHPDQQAVGEEVEPDMGFGNLEAYLQWHTSSNKALPLNHRRVPLPGD